MKGQFLKLYVHKELQNPPPLRSAMFPLGLPNLSDYHRAKVDNANILYKLAIDIILFYKLGQIIVGVENPANSWL